MPTYEYKCEPCRTIYRVHHGMNEEPVIRCPECNNTTER
jgi:putative FmdB family regulatory protein